MVAKKAISIMAITISCKGVVTPRTAPNEMRTLADAKSAFNILKRNGPRRQQHVIIFNEIKNSFYVTKGLEMFTKLIKLKV